MHRGARRPLPESLPVVIERDGEQAPQYSQTHIQHDGLHIAGTRRPRGDKLAETVACASQSPSWAGGSCTLLTPHVFVDGDRDEDGASDGFVRVDGIGADDGRDCGDLNAGGAVADDDNSLAIRLGRV